MSQQVETRFKVEVLPAPKHEARLRARGCLVPGCRRDPIHLHHVRHNSGVGMKPPPSALVPLCWHHHQEGHHIGWKTWERRYGLNLTVCAAWLAFHSRCLGILK